MKIVSIDYWPKQDVRSMFQRDPLTPLNLRDPEPKLRLQLTKVDGELVEIEANMAEILQHNPNALCNKLDAENADETQQ